MLKAKNEEEGASKSKNWYNDKYQSVLVQRNFFAVITLISLLTSLAFAFAIQNLTPLKSIEPFVIQVDEKSGITEVVDPATKQQLEASEAIDNFFVWQYVRARETHDVSDNNRNREIVRVMSHPDIFTVFRQEISPQNPESAYTRLGDIGQRVTSDPVVTYLKDDDGKEVAQVRFIVTERRRNEAPFTYNKIATLTFEYYELDLKRRERLINPLGFQVLKYRLDDATVQR